MKFGQQLHSSLIKDWAYHYIRYDELKTALKTPYIAASQQDPHPKRRPWTEDNEKAFVAQLEAELDKVFTFQRVKSGEIVRRIKSSETEVNDVIEKLKDAQESQDGGNSMTSVEPSEQDFQLLEEDLSDIIADVHDLAKFVRLNYTGFAKIVKKHDKQTSWHLKPVFAARLKTKPFFRDNYDAFILKLSRLYDLVRTRGNPIQGDSAAGGGQQNFVRQTTKYWIHPDNITELKLIILKHLPVLVFNASKEFDIKDSAISSIYYDNPETWELYTGRLKKTEGAEAIRLRWYGGMDTETIFVERKTHREDWTGEKSVKARFSIKEKNVNAFLSGQMTVEQVFEKMRREGKKSEKDIANLEQLAREIQYSVLTGGYVPVTRSFYNRTAFQLPGDARVRISLDTELTMTREDNLDGTSRCGQNWRRMDIGIDHPFPQLSPQDKELFPYAVLEVKLQTQAGQEPPIWVRELVSSHLVEAVPKYSKFIHGTATLFPTRINLLPFWMPQMDIDIRKPSIQRFGIERPAQSASYGTTLDNLDYDSEDEDEEEAEAEGQTGHLDAENSNGEETTPNEGTLRIKHQTAFTDPGPNALDIEERIAAISTEPDDYPLYDSEDEDAEADALEEARQVGGWQYRRHLFQQHITTFVRHFSTTILSLVAPKPNSFTSETTHPPDQVVQVRRFKAPKGKRIHIPVRVEPKVYFAAERTFLSWLECSIVIAAVAGALMNFGDEVGFASAYAFTALACACLLYSASLYLWRVRMIRERRAVRYHDRYGPTVLCCGLLAAVSLTFGLRIRSDGWFG